MEKEPQKTEATAIQKAEPAQSPIIQIGELVRQSDGKIDTAGLEKMLEMQFRYEANEARKAFVVAMAAFKANPPQIVKDRTVSYGQTKYNHASLANVTACINSALSEHGLSSAWKTEPVPATEHEKAKIRVTCKITHVMGHSEETSLDALPDDSGKKNLIQQAGSTITYLQRYTLLALTGLATYEQDDDGNGAGKKPPTVRPPTDEEWGFIDMICKAVPAPDGMRVDRKKVAAICYEATQLYPYHEKAVPGIIRWFTDMDRPELFIPDNRSDWEKQEDMPGDEDSVPDTEADRTATEKFGKENEIVPCRFLCKACDHEYDRYIKIDQCPKCLTKDVIDRQAKQ